MLLERKVALVHAAGGQVGRRVAEQCALVTKKGVCHECVELSEYFTGKGENPLEGTSGAADARLAILRERRETALGPWHTKLMVIVDDLLRR
jgi:hypothetical protein